MSDLDVALKLRLLFLGRGAKDAKRSLTEVRDEARKLAGVRTDSLPSGLKRAAAAAGGARREIAKIAPEARKAGEAVKGIGSGADQAKAKVERLTGATRKAGEAAATARKRVNELAGGGAVQAGLKATKDEASSLDGAMLGLGASAGRAFGALSAFVSVGAIVKGMDAIERKAGEVDRKLASAAVTAEMRDPKVIEDLRKRNGALGVRYGLGANDVTAGRQAFAAAGFNIERQDAVLDPTLRAAKAGDSTPETMARAVTALVQNLKVDERDIPAALDMMSKGAKVGAFEIDNMAKSFPSLGAGYQSLGREGLSAVSELVALAQIVRQGSGTSDEAATNLANLLQKATSPDTIKNFKEKGVDLEAVSKKANAQGSSYLLAMVDEAMRVSKGDPFVMGELFGDMQAKQALRPLIDRREQFQSFLKQIREESAGTVDADWQFLRDRPAEQRARRDAALEQGKIRAGQASSPIVGFAQDVYADLWDVEGVYRAEKAKAREAAARAKDPAAWDAKAEFNRRIDWAAAGRDDAGMKELRRLQNSGEMDDILDDLRQQRAQRKKSELPKVPDIRGELEKNFKPDLGAAATDAMTGYNAQLEAEGARATSIAEKIAAEIKARLNFTAMPTISPRFDGPAVLPPGASPTAPTPPALGKQGALPGAKGVKTAAGGGGSLQVTQHIYGVHDPKAAARESARLAGRAVRAAKAGALHDFGSATA